MGLRNPFRIDVDPETDAVTWGDYGPDAGAPSAERGPLGYVEWQTTGIDKPMNGGWPYCTGDKFNYNEWNFATATPGDVVRLCGRRREQLALEHRPGDRAAGHPRDALLRRQQHPPAVARADRLLARRWPGPDGRPGLPLRRRQPVDDEVPRVLGRQGLLRRVLAGLPRGVQRPVAQRPRDHINHFLPNTALETNGQAITDSPMDLEFGPDGSLYVLDYGDGFFRANPDAGLYRIDYTPGNKAPTARISADPISSSTAPLTVAFTARVHRPRGRRTDVRVGLRRRRDVRRDRRRREPHLHDARQVHRPAPRHRRPGQAGHHEHVDQRRQRRTDGQHQHAERRLLRLGPGRARHGHDVRPRGRDATACARVTWTFGLGPRRPRPPAEPGHGMPVAIPTPADATQHGETENIFGVVVLTYTDAGANGVPAATTTQLTDPQPEAAAGRVGRRGGGCGDHRRRHGQRPAQGDVLRRR